MGESKVWVRLSKNAILGMAQYLEDVWEVPEIEDVMELDGCWKEGGSHLRREGGGGEEGWRDRGETFWLGYIQSWHAQYLKNVAQPLWR